MLNFSDWNKDKTYILLFSGGLDSCAVLGAARGAGLPVRPVWVDNGFSRASADEIREQAQRMAGTELEVLEHAPPRTVCQNPERRCFYCKSAFLHALEGRADVLLDGTTADDLGRYRPGLEALRAFAVRSPLADANMGKQAAHELALHYGADPHIAAMESCLATRLRYGLEITPGRLEFVRQTERWIIAQTGDYDVRCRLDDADHLRIELKRPESFARMADSGFREALTARTRGHVLFTTLDLQPSRPNAWDRRVNSE